MTRVTVWDSQVPLGPFVPVDLVRTPDVLVIGGGVVGTAVGVACVRAGLGSVVVLEREQRLASAASGANGEAVADWVSSGARPSSVADFDLPVTS